MARHSRYIRARGCNSKTKSMYRINNGNHENNDNTHDNDADDNHDKNENNDNRYNK